jgi:SAM-dependent methyltransferase
MGKDGIDWEQLYQDRFTPWDVKRPDSHLERIIQNAPVRPCRALELGCGTGTNAIWLARQGFTVTALDLSETALAQARKKDGADACAFLLADFFDDPVPGTDFGFVFDLGCMHGFSNPEHRDKLARRIAQCLSDGGYWLNISASLDGPAICPSRLSAREITAAVEPYFEIVSLTATVLDNLSPEDKEVLGFAPDLPAPRAFCCFMRKRSPEEA